LLTDRARRTREGEEDILWRPRSKRSRFLPFVESSVGVVAGLTVGSADPGCPCSPAIVLRMYGYYWS
jgi:hypothetical protein